MSMLSLSDAKAHLNITGDDRAGQLQGMIDAAEAAIARRVGPLEATTVTATVVGSQTLNLPVYPVLSLTSVASSAGVSLPLDGISVDTAAGILTAASGAFSGGSFTITYSAGRTSCPDDLVMAVKELVRHLWETQRGPTRRPGGSTSDAAANTIPGAAYLFPFRVEQLLAPHEQFGFA